MNTDKDLAEFGLDRDAAIRIARDHARLYALLDQARDLMVHTPVAYSNLDGATEATVEAMQRVDESMRWLLSIMSFQTREYVLTTLATYGKAWDRNAGPTGPIGGQGYVDGLGEKKGAR